jgi:predicted secreted protein
MTITAALVLFAVTWFLVFFCVLPLRLTTQGDAGSRVAGTPAGAPVAEIVGHKARITTVWAVVVWALLVAFVMSGVVSIRDIDFFGRMGPETAAPAALP